MEILEILVGVVMFFLGLVYYSEDLADGYKLFTKRPWYSLSLLLVIVLGPSGPSGDICGGIMSEKDSIKNVASYEPQQFGFITHPLRRQVPATPRGLLR